MRVRSLIARVLVLGALPVLAGCYAGQPSREYDLDILNATDRTINLELLRIGPGAVRRTRADLAAGGSFLSTFTVHGSSEYLEARLRPAPASGDGPVYVHELRDQRGTYDIGMRDDAITLTRRRPRYEPDPG